MKTRSGQDRRQDQPERWLEDPEVKKVRVFKWTKQIMLPLAMKALPLFIAGGVAATQVPKVYDMVTGEDSIDVVDGDVHAITNEDLEAQQNRAINEIIEKLKRHDTAIANARRASTGDDTEQNARLTHLEALVQ